MKRSDWTGIKIGGEHGLAEGVNLRAEFLGKGHHATAYRVAGFCDSEYAGKVLLFVGKDDHMKDLLSQARDADNPHVPWVDFVESQSKRGKDADVWAMPYYPTVTKLDARAWGQYRLLEKLLKQAQEVVADRHGGYLGAWGWDTVGYQANTQLAQYCSELAADGCPHMPESLAEAIDRLADWALNYGEGVMFEFAPRNLGVNDQTGDLVLRDVLFDAKKLRDERAAKAARRDPYYSVMYR